MRSVRGWAGAVAVGCLAAVAGRAADPPAAAPAVVTDKDGKEIKLAGAKVTGSVRRLGWLGDPKTAPLALAFREPDSTTYQDGVLTLIPLASVEAVRFDADKQAVTVTVKGLAGPVAGNTKYKGINVLDVDGDAGGVTGGFTSGPPPKGKGPKRGELRAVTFPDAKPLPSRPADAAAWAVQIDQPTANNPTLAVRNLKAVYRTPGGGETLADAIPARKGDPLTLAGKGTFPKRVEFLAVDVNTHLAAVEVQPADGPERLAVLQLTTGADAKSSNTLVGLLGEVDAGWKLFPLRTVKAIARGQGSGVGSQGSESKKP